MEVVLNQAGKRYKFEWIFKDLDLRLEEGGTYGIQGPNGSGKSTLLKVLSGFLSLSAGQCVFQKSGNKLDPNSVYAYTALTGPYIELIEEFSALELVRFQFQFRPPIQDITPRQALDYMYLDRAAQKEIRYLSSGMKQRLKLGLTFMSNAELLLLDEPSSNLDRQGKEWVQQLRAEWKQDRTIVIASNEEQDFVGCQEMVSIMDYKPVRKKGRGSGSR